MDRKMLEFLFIGPLFSLFKVLNELRRDIMGLKEQLTDYGNRIDTIAAELRSDIERLQTALANAGSVPADVQAAADSLGAKISNLESLDVPNGDDAIDTGTAGGTSILRPTEPVPDETTVNSPGEPNYQSVEDLPGEQTDS